MSNHNKIGLLCHHGIEQAVGDFCKQYGKVIEIKSGFIVLETEAVEHVALYCGGVNRIVSLLFEGNYTELLASVGTLAVSKEFHVHSYSTDPTTESLQEQREAVVQALETTGHHWNPKKPEESLYLILDNDYAYLGSDVVGVDLGKRSYKAYHRQPPLRGPFGWALWQLLGLEKKQKVWCPSILDGTLPIEASLIQTGISPWQFTLHDWEVSLQKKAKAVITKGCLSDSSVYAWSDQWPHISATKANAKLANIEKGITFSKNTLDWIDLKFEKESFDLIGAHLIGPSPKYGKAHLYFEELCKQADYLLKKKGKMGVISTSLVGFSSIAATYKLRKNESSIWWMGKQELFVEVYVKP